MKGQLKPDAWKISSKLQGDKKSGNHAKVLGRGVALSKAGWMQIFYYYRCFFLKIQLYEFFMKKVIWYSSPGDWLNSPTDCPQWHSFCHKWHSIIFDGWAELNKHWKAGKNGTISLNGQCLQTGSSAFADQWNRIEDRAISHLTFLSKMPKLHIKDRIFSKWCQWNWISTCRRMELDPSLAAHIQIRPKWIRALNVQSEALKLLDERIGKHT